ncbi:MAG: cytochrome b/b6 domain-containing protein [Microbacteriaceae bacterium]|nr:cytochrome b/b6 domain-containing protein [Microbacteriaceae bacterium]
MTDERARGIPVLVLLIPAALGAFGMAVLFARALFEIPVTASFFQTYPGMSQPWPGTPVGFPAWLSWTHFLNAFLMLFVVRSGLLIRSKRRPPAFVTRRAAGARRLGLHAWWHIVVDVLWALNGAVYLVLLVISGQWKRLIPADWDVIPNAVSAGLQYLAFEWPEHDGWVHYNALQLLMYGFTVFVAGPLAVVAGVRLSPIWPLRWSRPRGVLSDAFARAAHWWIAVYLIAFTVLHVTLVLTTGVLRNLNHMYAGRDDDTWIGAGVFAVSIVVSLVAFVLLGPRVQTRLAELARNDVRRMPPA